MGGQAQIRADDIIRALAAAAAAVRLYPPTSEIPVQALARFVDVSRAVTKEAKGPIRFVVEPKGFRLGDIVLAEGQTQVAGFAESLYAHQVGQLIVAPEVTAEEARAFLRCATADAAAVREEGGLRSVIVAAGVANLAVVELTLRASTEEGLLGLDLTSAPLEVIGPAAAAAATEWTRTASQGEGHDEVFESIGSMEAAARDLASERIAQALLRLDEQTRAAVLAAAVREDNAGKTMEGMLSVIAGMKPATLARLLTLAASRTGTDANSIMSKLTLTPDAMRAVELLLRPSPRAEAELGVPTTTDPQVMAEEAEPTDEDEAALAGAKNTMEEPSQAPRALVTTIRLVEAGPPDEAAIEALGGATAKAVAVGAFKPARTALDLIKRLEEHPGLDTAISRARHSLTQGQTLVDGLVALTDPGSARDAALVLDAAGTSGPEAFLDAWLRSPESHRPLLAEIGSAIAGPVIAATNRRVRSGDPNDARELVGMLSELGDRRAVSSLCQALDHPVGEVRAAAIAGLARLDTEDAWAAIASTLTHPDESTARRALAAIRDAGKRSAVPAMLAILQLHASGARNHALKLEIIREVRRMEATEAIPDLKRIANRRFAVSGKARQLRSEARHAVAELQAARQAHGERMHP